MSEYINDTGGDNYLAKLEGTYSTDADNKIITFGEDGEADTEFILPSGSAWFLIETYDIEDTNGNIGYTKWQDDISQVDVDLVAIRNIVNALHTTYKMKATLFDGTSTAKVFMANEATAFPSEASPSYTVVDYVPLESSWIISAILVSPDAPDSYVIEMYMDDKKEVSDNKIASFDTTEEDTPPTYGANYYIATDGDDGWIGDIENPFRTLEGARDTIRALGTLPADLPTNGVCVWLREGVHYRDGLFTLTSTDKGSDVKPIHYRRYPNEKVRINGGFLLESASFSQINSGDVNYAKFDPAIRDNIYVYDLGADGRISSAHYGTINSDNMELFIDEAPATLARYPKKDTTTNIPRTEDSVLTLYGTTTPAVAGTYTKETGVIKWKRDGLVEGVQYYIDRKEYIGMTDITKQWRLIEENTEEEPYWYTNITSNNPPRDFINNYNGSTGHLSFLADDDQQFGFAFTKECLDQTTFKYAGVRPETWASLDDVWINSALQFPWSNDLTEITSVGSGEITLASEPLYGLEIGENKKAYYAFNIIEEVTTPGEYYIDKINNFLYYYPFGDIVAEEIIVSQMWESLVEAWESEYVKFYGIIFENTRSDLVELADCTYVTLDKCTARNTRRRGFVSYQLTPGASMYNGFDKCETYDCCEESIKISGGERDTLIAGGNYFTNGMIRNPGRLHWTQHAAYYDGCGNIFDNNIVKDSQSGGIVFTGNNHSIKYNDMSNILTFIGDGGAIYCGRSWGYCGNEIEENYIHDIENYCGIDFIAGIYMDDGASDILVNDNYFGNIDGLGMMNNGGRYIVYEDNIHRNVTILMVGTNGVNFSYSKVADNAWNLLEKVIPGSTVNNPEGIDFKAEPWASAYPNLYAMPNTWTTIEAAPEWLGPKGCEVNNNASTGEIRLYSIQEYGELDNAVLYTNIDAETVPIEDITGGK